MKKIFVILLLIPVTVVGRAINPLCNQGEKLKLRNDTYNFSYGIEKYREDDSILYKITILNIKDNIVVEYLNNMYSYSNNVIIGIKPGTTVTLRLLANPDGICDGYFIGNKMLNIPYYNKYKDNELCIGNEEYFLCKENINTNISEEEFNRQINSYINSKNNKVEEKEEEVNVIQEKSLIKDILNFLEDNYMYILYGIITVCVLVMLGIVIKKHTSNDIL